MGAEGGNRGEEVTREGGAGAKGLVYILCVCVCAGGGADAAVLGLNFSGRTVCLFFDPDGGLLCNVSFPCLMLGLRAATHFHLGCDGLVWCAGWL